MEVFHLQFLQIVVCDMYQLEDHMKNKTIGTVTTYDLEDFVTIGDENK